ncbi:MAG: Helix-turn-helix domain [Acidimicrobiaceae bacterium]|jgi:excisionase family DNA binding protein
MAEVAVLLATPEEAAAALRMSRATVYVLMRTGELRSVVVGARSRRIPVAALTEFVERLAAAAEEA